MLILDSSQVEDIIRLFQDDFIIEPKTIRYAVESKRLFQALDNETLIKVDFHVGESIPGELNRSVKAELF